MRLFPYLGALGPYLRRYRGEILKGYLCVVAQAAAEVAVPGLLKRGVDGLQRGESKHFLLVTAAWILGLSAVSGIFLFLKRWILIGASRLVEFDLRNDFFKKLTELPLSFYHRNRTGDLMARATNDLNAVRDVVGPALMYGMTTVTTVVLLCFRMLRLDPILTLATLIPFPIMAVIVSRFAQEVHRRSLKVQDQYGVLSAAAQENISGIRVVQSYVQEEAEKAHFARLNDEYLKRNLSLIRFRALFQGSIALLLGASALLLLWIGGVRVIRGEITLGVLVAFMACLAILTWPLIAVGWVISLVQRGEAAMQRILQVWREKPEIESGPAVLDGRARGELVFENVSFAYPSGPPVLRGIDLRVPPGSTLAIVGRTGSGKTSLVHLIPRLQDPTGGRILLDGHDLRGLRLPDLRRNVGMVPQDSFLFSDTLEGNIRFGRETAGTEEIERVARLARLGPDLAGFAQGLLTPVGERGVTLSGGQRQRAALARALLKDPAILILDDALSALDKSTEAELLEMLRSFASGRTVILIAHRISTVREADLIIVLDRGAIAERGTHEELLRNGGPYADLARRQALAEELDGTDAAG